jgi:hypothetical protein
MMNGGETFAFCHCLDAECSLTIFEIHSLFHIENMALCVPFHLLNGAHKNIMSSFLLNC